MRKVLKLIAAATVLSSALPQAHSQECVVGRGLRHGMSLEPDSTWDERIIPFDADLQANFFFINNEYFAPQVEGYTLVGYVVRPSFKWSCSPGRLLLSLGVHSLRYGGADHAHRNTPYIALGWRISRRLSLQMGSLPGSSSHCLSDATLNPEAELVDRPEFGAQLQYCGSTFSGHAWVNWRQFIFLGDTIPERFTAGISASIATHSTSKVAFSMPFAVVFNHVGGQISNYDSPMQSLANAEVSPTIHFLNSSHATIRRLSFTTTVYGLHTMAGTSVRPISDGWAVEPKFQLHAAFPHKRLSVDATASWFRAHDFYAISNYDTSLHTPSRSLFVARATLQRSIGSSARFSLTAKAFYDGFDNRFDYSYGFSLSIWPFLSRAIYDHFVAR